MENLNEKIKKTKEKIKIRTHDIVCAAIFILSMLILGLYQLFDAGFDPSYILSISFWLAMATRCLSNGMVLFSSASNSINKNTEKNERITHYKNSIALFIEKDLDNDFDEMLFQINRQTKIDKYKEKINRKLQRLDLHRMMKKTVKWKKYLQDLATNEDLDINAYGKYVCKKQQLLNKLRDEYIENNIDYIRIRYKKLTRSSILSNFKATSDTKYEIINQSSKMTKDLLSRFAMTASFTLVFYSLSLDIVKVPTILFVFNLITNMFVLIMNYYNGLMYGKSFVENIVLTNYLTRKQVCDEYRQWKSIKTKTGA